MIIIRPFKEGDIEAIITLFTQAVHGINKKNYSQEQLAAWAPEKQDMQKWQKKLCCNITFVAEKDGMIIGFADMTLDGYLDHLYISPVHQGGLVSLKLLKAIIVAAKERELESITTDCSITAKKPAERMGFVVIREQIVEKNGINFINYAMKKKL